MINATAAITNITVSANLVATQPVGENNLLDIYGGAAAAYSLRRLSKDATNVVRVRRSSDNTEANFTAEQILDGDLLRWVGLGASNNGFVTTWYDQSGNGNNAVQATAANQPQIVDAGNLITSNGYTVIKYDGTDDNLTTSLTATGTMLMGGSDGSAFYEVDINGSYSLLASALLTDHPLNESIRVIWSSSLTTAQKAAIETAVTYTDWDFSDVTNFSLYWRERSELTDFPLIDTSSGTNFESAWRFCSSLTSFPALDVSIGTDFRDTWRGCSSLTSFPLLDVSGSTAFNRAWRQCSSLTSFPALDLSSGTNFSEAWGFCSILQDFPANRFDSVTATNFSNAFTSTNLSSQSIENIVVSIDTAGQSNGTLNITGGSNATTATAQTAIDSLTAKGWTVTVPDGYVSPYVIDVYQGSAAAYSLRQLSYNTIDVVRVRRSVDNAEADFNPTEITDGTLLSFVNGVNLLTYSNQFNTNWFINGTGTLTSGQAGYDGSNNAWLLSKSASSTYINQSTSTSGINTFSVYAKAGTNTHLAFWIRNSNQGKFFDLVNGTIGSDFINTPIDATIESVGNGWYRCSVTTNDASNNCRIYPADGDGDITGASGSIYIQDAQLELGSTVTTYTETTDAPAGYGYVTTWYDQSGNSNDATQATAASQPKIVNAGSLITSNGYQVIQYDGTDDNLTTSLTATGTMLMGGSDGSDFYEVAISGSYSLLASASLTDHPLNESIRVIWGSSLTTAQKTAIESLVTYTDWDFSDVTSFVTYWRARSELTDFPLIDTSSGTTFTNAWVGCNSLTSFPLLNVSNGINFQNAWLQCSSLTSFPLLNVSSSLRFDYAWYQCSSLTSFPLLDVSSGTNFQQAWQLCTSLQDFPANMFDGVTATNFTNAFQNTNLSSQSIENIVVSIDTAGQSNGTLNITGGGNATTATAQTAIDNLRGRGWTVTVPDGY